MPGSSFWKCKNGHVLGVIRTIKNNGGNVHRLHVYRHALQAEGEGDVDVMADVEGAITDVRCDICGDIRTWYPDENSLRAMIRKFKERRYA